MKSSLHATSAAECRYESKPFDAEPTHDAAWNGLTARFNLGSNQTHLVYASGMSNVNHIRDVGKWDVVVALHEHHLFGARLEDVG
jgi:hypothetical protein